MAILAKMRWEIKATVDKTGSKVLNLSQIRKFTKIIRTDS